MTPQPMICVTGMCLVSQMPSFYPRRSEAEIQTEKNNREVIDYLKLLGYTATRDYSRREGVYWHDVTDKNGKLVCQIDGGVSLDALRQDMCAWHEGREGVSTEDYDVRGSIDEDGKMTESFKTLCQYVAHKPPETQLSLPL